MPPDVPDRLGEVVDDLHREDEVEVLRVPVLVPGRARRGKQRARAGAAAKLDAGGAEASRDGGKERGSDVAMHEQGLDGVADPRPLRLGVVHQVGGHPEIRGRVDEDVHESLVVLQDRDTGALCDHPDELFPAPGDDQIEVARQIQQRGDRRPVGVLDELDRVGGRADLLEGLRQHGGDLRVGLDGFAAAAEHHGVAGLQAEAGRVGRDVRTRLVDETDHAERDPNTRDLDPVRPAPGIERLAHRIGQRGDLPERLRHLLDARVGECQAVEERPRVPARARALEIGPVGLEELRRLLLEPAGHLEQGLVLQPRGAERQFGGRRARGPRLSLDQLSNAHPLFTRRPGWRGGRLRRSSYILAGSRSLWSWRAGSS